MQGMGRSFTRALRVNTPVIAIAIVTDNSTASKEMKPLKLSNLTSKTDLDT